MKEILKRELNKTYLILSSEDTFYEESYEVQMITNNEPQRILPLHVLRVDGNLQLFYEVSSKQLKMMYFCYIQCTYLLFIWNLQKPWRNVKVIF